MSFGFGCLALFAAAALLTLWRFGDAERVALDCAHDAVSMEREQIDRVLSMNATALRRAGRRQEARALDQLQAKLKSRPLNLSVKVRPGLRLGRSKKGTVHASSV